MSHGMNKIAAERNLRALLELAIQPGNDACADCKTRNPRWASHSLGIFLCMNCASIHRKMGTHISKVKSLTMDTWSKEQVEVMKNTGNIKSNAYFNPDEARHPPPANMVDSERDSELEKFIRSKYEFKSFVSRSAQVLAVLGQSQSASSRLSSVPPARSRTAPVPHSTPAPPVPPKTPAASLPSSTSLSSPSSFSQSQFRSVSQPVSSSPTSLVHQNSPLAPSSQQQQQTVATPGHLPWSTLMSFQASSTSSTLPPQFATSPSVRPSPAFQSSIATSNTNPYTTLSASPSAPFPSAMNMAASSGTVGRSASLNTGLSSASMGVSQPFQQTHAQTGLGLLTSNPNPFTSQMGVSSPFGGPSSFPAQGSPFGQTQQPRLQSSPFGQTQQPQPQPLFQTQNLGNAQMPMQIQMPTSVNPFLQHQQQVHTPFAMQPQPQYPFTPQPQTQFGVGTGMGAPSPFGQLQQTQMQMQQQQPAFSPGNPFATWQNQQQGGFPGQQTQWGGT